MRDPGSFSATPNAVELGWHYYLAGLDSGFVYYGCHDDECQRAAVAQSNAVRNVNGILAGNPAGDTTPPTLFPPQRHPWNPGGTNFGVQYGYKLTVATNSDFWVWTYGYDVSGITNVTLQFRINGTNPPTSDQFKTYAGGPQAGPWLTSNMTQRVVAPVIGVTPQYIADYYYAKVRGITNSYVDYYVTRHRQPRQHLQVPHSACLGRRGPGRRQRRQSGWLQRPRLRVAGAAGSRHRRHHRLLPGRRAAGRRGRGEHSPRLERVESGRVSGPGDDLQLRLQSLGIHGDRARQRDPVGLRLQQRQRHLGQQQRRRLAFLA